MGIFCDRVFRVFRVSNEMFLRKVSNLRFCNRWLSLESLSGYKSYFSLSYMAYKEFENRSLSLLYNIVLFLKINDFILDYLLTALNSKPVRSSINEW